MLHAQRRSLESRSGASSEGAPAHPDAGRTPWHPPVITRLSLDHTLFGSGSPTDGDSGSTPG